MTYTETHIQNVLCRWAFGRSHLLVVPNVWLFAWESDLVSVTKAGMVYDFEIKISRADFKRDAEKRRHSILFGAPSGEAWPEGNLDPRRFGMPNYFYYVTPAGLLTASDLPDRAGLIEIHGNTMEIVERALRLHKEPLAESRHTQLARSLMYRYWRLRGKRPASIMSEEAE